MPSRTTYLIDYLGSIVILLMASWFVHITWPYGLAFLGIAITYIYMIKYAYSRAEPLEEDDEMRSFEIRIDLENETVYLTITRASEEAAIAYARWVFPDAIEIECEGEEACE